MRRYKKHLFFYEEVPLDNPPAVGLSPSVPVQAATACLEALVPGGGERQFLFMKTEADHLLPGLRPDEL